MRLLQLISSNSLSRQVHLELIVDRSQLSLGRTLSKQRLFEELREDVESLTKLAIVDREMEVGVLIAGASVRVAAILAYKVLVVIFFRVLLAAEEQHVLAEVCHAVDVLRGAVLTLDDRILQAARLDKHARRTGLLVY